MINKFSKFGLLILLPGVLFIQYSNAQTPVCNLRFDIFEFNSEQPVKPVDKLKAVLTDLATKKTKESSALTEAPLFSNLNSGKYKIEVIKTGYQRRIKEFELNCKTADEILTVSKALYLRKGSVKEVTKFDSKTVIGKKGGEVQFAPKSNESITNDNAAIIAKPNYPAAARAVRASGAVNVQVTIDEDGEIVSANAVSGHPLLRQAAERAAKESRFSPTTLQGQPVKITGTIVYNFVP